MHVITSYSIHYTKLYDPERQGKAYGLYTTDVSKWCLAYIIGREVYPGEILTTNENNGGITSFTGNHFSIESARGRITSYNVCYTKLLRTFWDSLQSRQFLLVLFWPHPSHQHHQI